MKMTNIVVDDMFRNRSDLMLTLFSCVGFKYDVRQMNLALGSRNDVLIHTEYPDNSRQLLELMDKYGLLREVQSYADMAWSDMEAAAEVS